MTRAPRQFADLLSQTGRRVLEGKVPALAGVLKTGVRFLAEPNLLDGAKSRALLALLEAALTPHLKVMEQPIPPEALWGMTENYAELLPKTVRARTLLLASRRGAGARAAERIGLLQLLRSDTFGQFAQVLSGRALRKGWGTQVLAYGEGDYAGPHNDHHPEDAAARDGYTDVHLTFCNAGVARQAMVYEHRGHFSREANLATLGGVTAYRLPFWHFTTPLQAKPRRAATARRWVLLGTFLDSR
jgi:hypothetical protein